MTEPTRPQGNTVDRQSSARRVTWPSGHESRYDLRWLRTNYPCATCHEDRRAAALAIDPLKLVGGPPLPTIAVGAHRGTTRHVACNRRPIYVQA